MTISKALDASRPLLRRLRRFIRPLIPFFTIVFLLDTLFTLHSSNPAHSSTVNAPVFSDQAKSNNESIYIASLHWNSEQLIREHWAPALLDLVAALGPSNVFVAIVEGGSWDDTKGALRELDEKLEALGVQRWVELDERTHAEEVERVPAAAESGWVDTPRGKKELRRIPFLAALRNRAMSKLHTPNRRRFDKVLWLNDVVFSVPDIQLLLATNNGHYAAACSLDFSAPPLYYDTFGLRDIAGQPTISMTWPYFLSSVSRTALFSSSAVLVKSCWNGIVVFDAAPFYSSSPSSPGLKFRGLPDSLAQKHLEASECCLIHADNPLSAEKGVFLNPNVRVGYNKPAYVKVHPSNIWPSAWERIRGVWKIRWFRVTGRLGRWMERRRVLAKIDLWLSEPSGRGEDEHREVGGWCTVDEMQIIVGNGWMHV
ncbi:cryptococcal mannosyltransferase 1-domain-containing protein [Bisporella sp. PMI_857]|nr:cryptococcal mannosyltransferase 1-domain-containing protein [Bisporella sp. PMI_857]